MTDVETIKELLARCTSDQREHIFRILRAEFSIHPLEERLNTQAEIILEAIQRSSGLTLRMIRGVIAEAAFEVEVVEKLDGWQDTTPVGDLPYDFQLSDGAGDVRIQVKLQRSLAHQPMMANQAYRRLPADMFVVETQRTRGGSDRSGGSTRPYRFGEFDIVAVAMHPSTNRWDRFMYSVADWLVPGPSDPTELLKFQPVSATPDDDWTDDFGTAVSWFRSRRRRTIRHAAQT